MLTGWANWSPRLALHNNNPKLYSSKIAPLSSLSMPSTPCIFHQPLARRRLAERPFWQHSFSEQRAISPATKGRQRFFRKVMKREQKVWTSHACQKRCATVLVGSTCHRRLEARTLMLLMPYDGPNFFRRQIKLSETQHIRWFDPSSISVGRQLWETRNKKINHRGKIKLTLNKTA